MAKGDCYNERKFQKETAALYFDSFFGSYDDLYICGTCLYHEKYRKRQ
jgi:hypothetical protein